MNSSFYHMKLGGLPRQEGPQVKDDTTNKLDDVCVLGCQDVPPFRQVRDAFNSSHMNPCVLGVAMARGVDV